MAQAQEPTNLTHHFLIAMPGVSDEPFVRSVVYMCEHSKRGALGLVINKPSDISLKNLFDKVDMPLRREDLIQPEAMVPPLLWLVSDAASGVTGERFLAALWDTTLSPEQAASRAASPIGWPQIGSRAQMPKGWKDGATG